MISSELLGKKIVLSASFPQDKSIVWEDKYSSSINPQLIAQCVKALLRSVFCRQGTIVFGGHPAITPYVLEVSRSFTHKDSDCKFVHIYQSKDFEHLYTDEARILKSLPHVVFIETPRGKDMKDSLKKMRTQMFTDEANAFAVFVGGKDGIIDEFDLFHQLNPQCKLYPIGTSGGAAKRLLDNASPEDSRIKVLQNIGIDDQLISILRSSQSFPFIADKIISDWRE